MKPSADKAESGIPLRLQLREAGPHTQPANLEIWTQSTAAHGTLYCWQRSARDKAVHRTLHDTREALELTRFRASVFLSGFIFAAYETQHMTLFTLVQSKHMSPCVKEQTVCSKWQDEPAEDIVLALQTLET